jgi:hypothetical protein
LNEFQTNLVPFPRIHYPLISYAPVISSNCSAHESFKVKDLTLQCMCPPVFFFPKCPFSLTVWQALNLGTRWSSAILKPESIWQWLFCTRVT